MAVFLSVIVGLLIIAITYRWMQVNRIRSKLKWLPQVPGLPVLGNALEFYKPTVLLNSFRKHLEKHDGLCTIELATYKFIIASNQKFLEFLLGKMDILNKSDEYKFLDNWLGTGILTTDWPKWKKTRKILTPAFHFSILDSFTDIFENNGDILVEKLEKETKEDSVEISSYVSMATLDIICETAMGVSINAQSNPKSDYVKAVKEKCRLTEERGFSPIKTFNLLYALTPDYYKEKDYVKTLHSYTLAVIAARKERRKATSTEPVEKINEDVGIKNRKAFLDLMLDATIDGRPFTDTEIREEVDTFMFAGHDTTASAISFALYCLAHHKDVQDKVAQEQKQIFGDDRKRSATNRDFQEMKYLELVIKESLRLYPSVPFIGRKTDKDVEYEDGKIIPAGTAILIIIYCVNRNPNVFPDPDKFDPSRFENNASMAPYTYIPFSAGPRNCIGQKFGLNVMRSVLSKILRNYEVLSSGHEIILSAETVLTTKNGIRLKLRKRDWDKL